VLIIANNVDKKPQIVNINLTIAVLLIVIFVGKMTSLI